MTENSAFWEGEITGDAASATGWEAPYLDTEKADVLARLMTSDSVDGYIIAEESDELVVSETAPSSLSVVVAAGVAFSGGRLYINTEVATLTLAANASGNPRIDRIILRTDVAAQTIRLAVLQGTPGATPSLPALTQTAATYEVSIAYIWVANGAASITNTEIHDERRFLQSFHLVNISNGHSNLILNSEYMAFTNNPSLQNKPTEWSNLSDNQTNEISSIPMQMIRGWSPKISSTGNFPLETGGMYQTFAVKPDTMYAIRGLIKAGSGTIATLSVSTNSYAPDTRSVNFYQTDIWQDEFIYYRTNHDATTMTVAFSFPLSLGNIIYCGQVLVKEGYFSGNYEVFHELLMAEELLLGSIGFPTPEQYNTGTTIWDFDTAAEEFVGTLPDGLLALVLDVRASENISPGTLNAHVNIRPYAKTPVCIQAKFSNCSDPVSTSFASIRRYGEVPVYDRKFEMDVLDNGVTSLSVTIFIMGIRT